MIMPALVMFKRKWLISCDDLVIPFIIEAILRIAWLIASTILAWFKSAPCKEDRVINHLLYAVIADLLLTSFLSIVIAIISSRGSNKEVKKRKHLTTFLYLKIASTFFDLCIASAGIWFFIYVDSYECIQQEITTFIKVSSVCAFVYIFILCLGMCLSYNSLGSLKYWNSDQNENKDMASLDFFKRAEDIWQCRLKFLCCCIGNNAENKTKYMEISTFLASFLTNIDLVPTDIVTGLAILSKKHALEKQIKSSQPDITFHTISGKSPVQSWMTIVNALHFLRIAKSTYGWIAFFDILHPCNLCAVMSHVRCCKRMSNSVKADNCCYCNTAALQKITGFSDEDLIYTSFHNDIHEPPFFIAVDHITSSIVIAIRGTLSLSDIVTDIDAESQNFPGTKSTSGFLCHSGVLKSAMLLHKKITELNVLPSVFAENPHYTLVLTGHSLGGSIASVLGYMLKSKYPDLRCYAFAPLAVFSPKFVLETLDFVYSVVVEDDLAVRLCVSNCKEIRADLIKCLDESKIAKYKVLTEVFCCFLMKIFCKKCHTLDKMNQNGNCINNNKPPLEYIENHEGCPDLKGTKLFAPGRIMYFERTESGCKSSWVTGFHFQSIIVSPKMMTDHQPHAIQAMLEQYQKLESPCVKIDFTNDVQSLSCC